MIRPYRLGPEVVGVTCFLWLAFSSIRLIVLAVHDANVRTSVEIILRFFGSHWAETAGAIGSFLALAVMLTPPSRRRP